MPSGVFKPYAGVSTAVLFFTKGGTTERIWFYDMAHDGLSLDDKRQPVAENDIPDIIEDWRHRFDEAYQAEQQTEMERLKTELEPLQAERLRLEGEMNRLQFEQVIAEDGDEAAAEALEAAKEEMEVLQAQIAPIQAQLDQLGRQFWVTTEKVKENKYDLSASRYREMETEDSFFERPDVTLKRLKRLDQVMTEEMDHLLESLQ